MNEQLAETLKIIPELPGCYLYYDKEGNVIYVGKAKVLKRITGEYPIALLDDVMSELDKSRQDFILNHIKDWQVFITCCDPSNIKGLSSGTVFEMKGGNFCNITVK